MTSGKVIFRNISLIPLLFFSNLLLSTIVVDGKLNEEEWESAQEISKFYQVGPFTLEEPEQKTIVKVYETEDGLYVGYTPIVCWLLCSSAKMILNPGDCAEATFS